MTRIMLIALVAALPGAAMAETRCGWFTNPTPANVFLDDADGGWTLSAQGRGGVPGFDDAWASEGSPQEWVMMSPAGYGYGCACVEGDFGPVGSQEVREVRRYWHRPLAACAEDPALEERDLVPMWEGE